MTNSEKEEIWFDAWSDLYELLESYLGALILLPGYIETDVENAQAWMQSSAYEGYEIEFRIDYFKAQESIFIERVK